MTTSNHDLAILQIVTSGSIDPRQVRGFVYRALQRDHPSIHDDTEPRPFTTAVLRAPDATTRVVITTIGPAITTTVTIAARELERSRASINAHTSPVLRIDTDGTTWQRLLEQTPTRNARFRFLTPVVFRRRGAHYALPEPTLVLGSLLASWNAFSPHPCPTDIGDELAHTVIPGEFNLRSVGVTSHERVRGATGSVTYHLRSASPEMHRWFARLTALAPYSGVGARTTAGFGHATTDALPRDHPTA